MTTNEERERQSLFCRDLLGYVPDAQCAVVDNKGRHCDQEPIMEVDIEGRRSLLCERCYENAINGAYVDVKIDLVGARITQPNSVEHLKP